MNTACFLTRKKLAEAAVRNGRARWFLTRKKRRDRDTPLGAKTVSARGPVRPALSIFGPRKTIVPPASAADAGDSRNDSKPGGKGMPP